MVSSHFFRLSPFKASVRYRAPRCSLRFVTERHFEGIDSLPSAILKASVRYRAPRCSLRFTTERHFEGIGSLPSATM
ncbi:hypothetical protein L6R29_25165 [Myxococcota bacterium]|nr:hypothetical protein [Myxococcota bacterium]